MVQLEVPEEPPARLFPAHSLDDAPHEFGCGLVQSIKALGYLKAHGRYGILAQSLNGLKDIRTRMGSVVSEHNEPFGCLDPRCRLPPKGVLIELGIVLRMMSGFGVTACFEKNIPYKGTQLICDPVGSRNPRTGSCEVVPGVVALLGVNAVGISAGEGLMKRSQGREHIGAFL